MSIFDLRKFGKSKNRHFLTLGGQKNRKIDFFEEKWRFLVIFLLSTAFDDHAGMPTLVKSVQNLKNRIPDAQKQSIREKNAIYEEKW